jgi:glycosyl transferase family 25
MIDISNKDISDVHKLLSARPTRLLFARQSPLNAQSYDVDITAVSHRFQYEAGGKTLTFGSACKPVLRISSHSNNNGMGNAYIRASTKEPDLMKVLKGVRGDHLVVAIDSHQLDGVSLNDQVLMLSLASTVTLNPSPGFFVAKPMELITINDTLPTIFVINMLKDSKRWALMKKRLRTFEGINVQRIEGINGFTHKFTESNKIYGVEKKGVQGCLLSHLRVWRRIISDDQPMAIVLEDDASPRPDFVSGIKSLIAKIPSGKQKYSPALTPPPPLSLCPLTQKITLPFLFPHRF